MVQQAWLSVEERVRCRYQAWVVLRGTPTGSKPSLCAGTGSLPTSSCGPELQRLTVADAVSGSSSDEFAIESWCAVAVRKGEDK